jgi:predicted N-acetyltransferase YhbS
MLTVRDETRADIVAREALLDRAMGEARFDKPSERLREGRKPAAGLALAAEHEGELIGTVRLWNISAGNAGEGLLLGPLAVEAEHRSLGVGARLMREALWRAARTGHAFVLLVGDAPYYERFGFSRAPSGLIMPGPTDPARFMAFGFHPGILAGAEGRVLATGAKLVTAAGAERVRRGVATQARIAA